MDYSQKKHLNKWDKAQMKVSVFPNPSANIFSVNFKKNFEATGWEVLDLHGSIIIKGNSKASDFIIDLSSHPKGIYYLKIVHKETRTVKKLVLQ